jgi:hypothetical protein
VRHDGLGDNVRLGLRAHAPLLLPTLALRALPDGGTVETFIIIHISTRPRPAPRDAKSSCARGGRRAGAAAAGPVAGGAWPSAGYRIVAATAPSFLGLMALTRPQPRTRQNRQNPGGDGRVGEGGRDAREFRYSRGMRGRLEGGKFPQQLAVLVVLSVLSVTQKPAPFAFFEFAGRKHADRDPFLSPRTPPLASDLGPASATPEEPATAKRAPAPASRAAGWDPARSSRIDSVYAGAISAIRKRAVRLGAI